MKALTPKQAAVLKFIKTFQEDMGRKPSINEMATATQKSFAVIHSKVQSLISKGYLADKQLYIILK